MTNTANQIQMSKLPPKADRQRDKSNPKIQNSKPPSLKTLVRHAEFSSASPFVNFVTNLIAHQRTYPKSNRHKRENPKSQNPKIQRKSKYQNHKPESRLLSSLSSSGVV